MRGLSSACTAVPSASSRPRPAAAAATTASAGSASSTRCGVGPAPVARRTGPRAGARSLPGGEVMLARRLHSCPDPGRNLGFGSGRRHDLDVPTGPYDDLVAHLVRSTPLSPSEAARVVADVVG